MMSISYQEVWMNFGLFLAEKQLPFLDHLQSTRKLFGPASSLVHILQVLRFPLSTVALLKAILPWILW
jgi:hypothetical protein